MFLNYFKVSGPFKVTQTVVWDLQGLEKELRERVYGQDEAVDTILQVIRDVVTSREANPRPKTIILVGGPGVGKHHVMDIIKNHIRCQPVNESATQSCELRFQRTVESSDTNTLKKYELTPNTNGTRPMFAYFSSLYYSWDETDNYNIHAVNYWYRDPLCFVTGQVMTQWSAQGIASFASYEQYLNYKEHSVRQFGEYHYGGSDIILVKFKPLTRAHVLRCFRKEHFNVNLPLYNTDFVPLGCKAR
jgi:hypothetical protein